MIKRHIPFSVAEARSGKATTRLSRVGAYLWDEKGALESAIVCKEKNPKLTMDREEIYWNVLRLPSDRAQREFITGLSKHLKAAPTKFGNTGYLLLELEHSTRLDAIQTIETYTLYGVFETQKAIKAIDHELGDGIFLVVRFYYSGDKTSFIARYDPEEDLFDTEVA